MATLTTVQFGPGGAIKHQSPTVYTRRRWADAWTRDDALTPTSVAWSCLPTMPTAEFVLHYGRVRWFDDAAWRTETKRRHMSRRYVKIVVPMQDDGTGAFLNKTWYGVFQVTIDQQDGGIYTGDGASETSLVSGVQQLTAFGLESLLSTHMARKHWFEFGGGSRITEQPIPFNRRGRGNRSTAKTDGSYVFTDVTSIAPPWSSRDIIEYLLSKHAPVDGNGDTQVPFGIHAGAWLPDWDDPQIDPTGQTTLGLIMQLASRQRLLSAWFEVGAGDVVELHTDTLVPSDVHVSIPGKANAKIPANSRQLKVICDDDQATALGAKESDLPLYDVVIAQGAPEVSIGSFSFLDSTLSTNWDSTRQVDYEAAATTAAGYAALNEKLKQKANAAARSSPRLDAVFSYFRIERTWNQECGNGENEGGTNPLFPGQAGGSIPVYYPTMFTESQLPLLAGADYVGTNVENGATGETEDMLERLPPLVFMKSPEDSRWMRIEDIGNAADLEVERAAAYGQFSVYAHVPPESHGFTLRVAGAPQHAIAYGDFTPLAGVDPDTGQWSFRTGLVATLAISSGRRTQARYPDTDPPGNDCIRTFILDVGDSFESVYVCPQTVVGVKADGSLHRSTGGWIHRPSNAIEHLAALAKVAAAWYTIPHYVVTLETQRLTTEIGLGDLIARIGRDHDDNQHQLDANAPVTEIRVEWPLTSGDRPQPPTMSVQTFAGELDPIQVQPGDVSIFDPSIFGTK